MKKVLIALIMIATAAFAGDPKDVVVGLLDPSGLEYNAGNIGGVTFKAWLETGSGPAVGADVVNQTGVNCSNKTLTNHGTHGATHEFKFKRSSDQGNTFNLAFHHNQGIIFTRCFLCL